MRGSFDFEIRSGTIPTCRYSTPVAGVVNCFRGDREAQPGWTGFDRGAVFYCSLCHLLTGRIATSSSRVLRRPSLQRLCLNPVPGNPGKFAHPPDCLRRRAGQVRLSHRRASEGAARPGTEGFCGAVRPAGDHRGWNEPLPGGLPKPWSVRLQEITGKGSGREADGSGRKLLFHPSGSGSGDSRGAESAKGRDHGKMIFPNQPRNGPLLMNFRTMKGAGADADKPEHTNVHPPSPPFARHTGPVAVFLPILPMTSILVSATIAGLRPPLPGGLWGSRGGRHLGPVPLPGHFGKARTCPLTAP